MRLKSWWTSTGALRLGVHHWDVGGPVVARDLVGGVLDGAFDVVVVVVLNDIEV